MLGPVRALAAGLLAIGGLIAGVISLCTKGAGAGFFVLLAFEGLAALIAPDVTRDD